jgi:hypothetical protein
MVLTPGVIMVLPLYSRLRHRRGNYGATLITPHHRLIQDYRLNTVSLAPSGRKTS